MAVTGECPHNEDRASCAVGCGDQVTVTLTADDYAFLTGFDPDRDRTASRADMVRVIEHMQHALTRGRTPDDREAPTAP